MMLVWVCCFFAAGAFGAEWPEQAKLLASDGNEGDRFGTVSIDADYVIVGAVWDDDNGPEAGSAYVFKREYDPNWVQQAKLLASDGNDNDQFGCSVSISGNYAIVGARADEEQGPGAGSAYIFKREGDPNWTQQDKITASDGGDYDVFGSSVGISGDYAIVGALGDDNKWGFDGGSAYIFRRYGETWSQYDKLVASDGNMGDYFGHSVSICGSYAIVGANRDDDKGTNSGSAYIFRRDCETWIEEDKVTASDGLTHDEFGFSVCISGEFAIVGAPAGEYNSNGPGAAYIYEREGENWTERVKLMSPDAEEDDYFGSSVCISGDYAIVGAYGEDDHGNESGVAYIYKRVGTDWIEPEKVSDSDGGTDDYFGHSVSISGHYAAVGACGDDDNGDGAGSAFVFKEAVCPPGNLTDDCGVNFYDFAIFAEYWLEDWN